MVSTFDAPEGPFEMVKNQGLHACIGGYSWITLMALTASTNLWR